MAKRYFILYMIYAAALFGEDSGADLHVPERIKEYLEFAKEHPDLFGQLGTWKKNEIEIILNPERIQKIEKQTALRLQSKGYVEKDAKQWSSVGVIAEDYYWLWIRDAVIFPSGVYGTYDRLMW